VDFLTYLRHQWDRVGAWVAVIAGAVALILGWIGASGQLVPAGQIPYVISGGLGGIFLLGLGAVLWLSADLRDEWRQLHDISRKLDGREHGQPLPPVSGNGHSDREQREPARRPSGN
jgi:hypothetical protein